MQVMSGVEPYIEPDPVHEARKISRKIHLGISIGMGMLKVVCPEQPMDSVQLRQENEYGEFNRVYECQDHPKDSNQTHLKNGFTISL
jgi:hypothetical protein